MVADGSMTLFGSVWIPLSVSCGPLRAMASRHGVSLSVVSDVDAASAVLSADVWMRVTGSARISDSYRYGRSAAAVLSSVLLRAAGSPAAPQQGVVQVDGVKLPSDLRGLESYLAVIKTLSPAGLSRQVVLRSALDLQSGGAEEPVGMALAGYGAALFLLEG